MDTRQLCTFWVDGHLFGVDVSEVQEIVREQRETPVPLAPKAVRALINLRGQVVSVIDMRRLLSRPSLPAGEGKPCCVVLRHSGHVFSLFVDEMRGVLDAPLSSFEKPTDRDARVAATLTEGVFKLDGELLLLLSVSNILAAVHAA